MVTKGAAPLLPELAPSADVVHLDTDTIYQILDARLPESVRDGVIVRAVADLLKASRQRYRS